MDIRGKSSFEVSSLLQGPKETFVTLEVIKIAVSSCLMFIIFSYLSIVILVSPSQVQRRDCGQVRSIKVKRQSVAQTPVFYRLEKMDDGAAYIGYVQLKEFNALAKKDLVIGTHLFSK